MSDDVLPSLTSLTVRNATAVLQQGLDALRAGQRIFDLGEVAEIDSAAVSVMLAWQRAARAAGTRLELHNLPPKLRSLTRLYGVDALLDDAPADGTASAADLHHH
jgi:phospholipid transport system transporter-binding protein